MKKQSESGQLLRGARRDSGSALLTAMLFAFVIGALSVTYLKMANSEYRASMRSSQYASSLNLAESGVEMAIAALNAGSVSGSEGKGEVQDFLQDAGFKGDVQYVIFDANTRTPEIYAEGRIHSTAMNDIKKQVRVELTRGFPPFEKGFSSRNGISFSGNNVILDSYNSKYGPYNADLPSTYIDKEGNIQTVPADYGVDDKNKNDDIYVASALLDESGGVSVSVGNADIYGYVSVAPGSRVSVNSQGMVTTYEGDDAGNHQESRVQGDFYADFPAIDAPTGSYTAASINGTTTITGSDDADNPTYYSVSQISIAGNADLTISGHVVFVMSGDIAVTGKASIILDDTANAAESVEEDKGSSLTIYTANDVNISGGGVTNDGGTPSDLFVYGTADMQNDGDAGQSIDISGNGVLSATVYAPNADVSLNGGGNSGDVFGGVVALTATVTGNSAFHFDEALRDIVEEDAFFEVTSWLEMTGETADSTPIDIASYFE
jgi:hypothetical protein